MLPLVLACGGDTTQPVPPPAPPPPAPPPPPPPPAPVASVTVTPAASTLVPQQTVQLTAETRDAGGTVLSGRTIVWTSGTPTAASVSAAGLVTGLLPGTPVITATSEGQAGTAAITVVDGGMVLPAGNGFSAGGGAVAIQAPAGAVATGTPVTVAALATPPAHPDLIPGTAWALGPDGTTFAQPVTVRITWAANQLPGGANAEQIRVHRHDGTTWVPLAAGEVNVGTRTASGTTTAFSPFVLIELPSNPLPVLTSLDPTSADEGGAAFTLTVTGTGFVASSEVRWNGEARTTTFQSATTLTAQISAADLLAPGTAQVTVVNPAPGGGTSAALPLAITAPVGEFLATDVWAGGAHSCAQTTTDGPYCWGWGSDGQLGNGAFDAHTTPVKVSGGLTFVSVSTGFWHTCALTGNGTAYCWGWGQHGRLGDGTTTRRNVPTLVGGDHVFASIRAGPGHTCGVTDTGVGYCWGWNESSRLGTGLNVGFLTTPTVVAGGHTFGEIAPGGTFSCGLTPAGAGLCWGEGRDGQLGTGTTPTPVDAPVAVTGAHVFSSIVAGFYHACAIATSGITYCWGNGANGRLGNQMSANQSSPVAVQGGLEFASISAGPEHTCGLTAAGVAYCWGKGSLGRLGDGHAEDRSLPTPVAGAHTFASISAGDEHSCGVTTNNEVYCWGWGDALGHGSTEDQLVPVRVIPAVPDAAGALLHENAAPDRGGKQTTPDIMTGRPFSLRR